MGFVAVPLMLVASSYGATKDGPTTVVSHVDIVSDAYKAGAEESAARLFRAERAASQKDEGLVSYSVLREVGLSNHFTVVEAWRDAKAYARHVGSPHTVRFRQRIQPFLGRVFKLARGSTGPLWPEAVASARASGRR